jgi:hypothetical protein
MSKKISLAKPMVRGLAVLGALAALSCSQQKPPPAVEGTATPYNVDLDLKELMNHVMNPSAFAFWKGWGMIYTPEGAFDISPRTEQEWEAVENGAAAVITVTNVLLTPPYTRDPESEWRLAAKNVADIAKAGKDAAEKHDKQAMYEIGSKLDEACDACHKKFEQEQRP